MSEYLIISLLFLLLTIAIIVAILRWALRINHIVNRLEDIKKLLVAVNENLEAQNIQISLDKAKRF